MFHGEPDAGEIDSEHSVPVLPRLLRKRVVVALDARVVVRDIEAAVRLAGRLHHRPHVVGVSDVDRDERRVAAVGLDFGDDLSPALGVDVTEHHVRTLGGESRSARPPDTAARAGHDRSLAV